MLRPFAVFRRFAVVCTLFLLPALMAGCEQIQVATPPPRTVRIAGSTAMQPVLRALTAEFHRQHPSALFDLRAGGSTLGEEQVARDSVEIAASTLLPNAAETGPGTTPIAADRTRRLVRTPIGLDGIAIIVNPANDTPGLTVLQLRDLFSGRVLSWREINSDSAHDMVEGGTGQTGDDDVLLVSREDGSGTRVFFEERIMGEEGVSLTAVVMPSSADVVDFVAKHPQAIGYVSQAYLAGADFEADVDAVGGPVRVLPLEGLLPTRAAISEQRYFLIQPLYLVTKGEPTGWIRQFVDFALSPPGQEIVDGFHARIR